MEYEYGVVVEEKKWWWWWATGEEAGVTKLNCM